ncbi:MAG TPA: ABC transporter permease [Conexibacter sp.]|jgi:tungstate transport system permease protein
MEFLWQMLSQAFNTIVDGDPELYATLWRTMRFALIATAIALVIGLPIALLLSSARSRGQRAGLLVANAGLGLPPVALGIYLGIALQPSWPLGGLRWSFTPQGVVLAQALLALPIVVALSAAALRAVPEGLLDQARAFGASRAAVAVLALREARVGIIAAVIASLGSAIAEVGAVVIVGGNSSGVTNTLASTVLLDLAAANPSSAVADTLILLAVLLVLALILTLVQRGRTPARAVKAFAR